MSETFRVKNLGPIKDCSVEFGDITIIIGPQASGKTMFLETFYLVNNSAYILKRMNEYLHISNNSDFLKMFYGSFKTDIISNNTKLYSNGKEINNDIYSKSTGKKIKYIPAQRSVSVSDGRFKGFNEFSSETPFVIKDYSDNLRIYIDFYNDTFPKYFHYIDSVYHGGEIYLDTETIGQKKLRLKVGDTDIPYSSWSMGQKEFTPLFMNLMFRDFIYTIIEEPELGLHPKAIKDFIANILEQMSFSNNRYSPKAVISTHTSVFLEFAWVVKSLPGCSEADFIKYMEDLFDVKAEPELNKWDKAFSYLYKIRNNIKVYFFNNGTSKDISNLDVCSEDMDELSFGGFTTFNSKACDIVATYNANKDE